MCVALRTSLNQRRRLAEKRRPRAVTLTFLRSHVATTQYLVTAHVAAHAIVYIVVLCEEMVSASILLLYNWYYWQYRKRKADMAKVALAYGGISVACENRSEENHQSWRNQRESERHDWRK